MSIASEFISGYGQINNGAHRQPAELVGAPAIVWHQAFWNPPEGNSNSSSRSQSIESYITDLQSKMACQDSVYSFSSVPSKLMAGERPNVITYSFVWKGLTVRIRLEIHTEYISITSIIDASLINKIDNNSLVREFGRCFDEFCDVTQGDAANHSDIHRFFYHDIWEKHFHPDLLEMRDHTRVLRNKFADLRGFVTCESYPKDVTNDVDFKSFAKDERSTQRCFYKEKTVDRDKWQRTSIPSEDWARNRLNRVWPFLICAIPHVVEEEPYLYGRIEYTASRLLDGRILYISALGPQPREGKEQSGHERPLYFYLHSVTQCERQIGRVVDRLVQLGTLRLAAIIALPALKKVVPQLEKVERDILIARSQTHNLIQYAKTTDGIEPSEIKARETLILNVLDEIQVTMSALSSGRSIDESHNLGNETLETRLLRSVYYKKMFDSLIKGLRLRRIEGYQQYDQFVDRRLGSIFGFIEAIDARVSGIKRQWGSLDQLYLTTAVTLLAGEIEGQQSEAKIIQRDISRIQLLGEAILIAFLTPYYFAQLFFHVLNCDREHWCSEMLFYSLSLSQWIQIVLISIFWSLAAWRFNATREVQRKKSSN